MTNDLYADTSAEASDEHYYSRCSLAESPDDENYVYIQTNEPDEGEACPYETPNTAVTSK